MASLPYAANRALDLLSGCGNHPLPFSSSHVRVSRQGSTLRAKTIKNHLTRNCCCAAFDQRLPEADISELCPQSGSWQLPRLTAIERSFNKWIIRSDDVKRLRGKLEAEPHRVEDRQEQAKLLELQ
jgi:hypothetical protein